MSTDQPLHDNFLLALSDATKYRALFELMDEGYCIIQMIYDKKGRAVDWRFLEVNRAFEKNNGLYNAEGKTIREMTPNIEDKWMKIYDSVAKTRKPLRFEEDSNALGRSFSLYAFPIDDPAECKVAVIFTDITIKIRQQHLEIFRQTVIAQEEERRRLSESLHNGIGQLLYAVKISLSTLTRELAETKPDEFLKRQKDVNEVLSMAINETRRISHGLMPIALKENGLQSAILDMSVRLSKDVIFTCSFSGLHQRLDEYQELAIYRIVQELMLNVVKHANASSCRISLKTNKRSVNLTVQDNGIGMLNKGASEKEGIGLGSISHKVKLMEGKMRITSVKGSGTKVSLSLPYN